MNGNQMNTSCSEILNADYLSLSNLNISNLFGIQYFNNLQTLECYNNQLTSLPALPNNLTYLDCYSNLLSNLPSLPNNLTYLDCSVNLLSNLPSLPNSLEIFSCNNNLLGSLPVLPNTITNLGCGFNQLSSLPVLPNDLEILFCLNNQLTSLPVLPIGLTYLDCSYNQMISMPALPASLSTLYCDHNQLGSLPTLPNSLTILWCNNNQLTSLPAIPNSLPSLNCSANLLTSLPTFPDSFLIINCSSNLLTSLPALHNSFNSLSCQNNQLSSLPPLPNSLTNLRCSYNQLNSLPILPNALQSFQINNNNISCLVNLPITSNGDISNNPLTCVPNQTNYSLGLPLCTDSDPVNNPNNCPGVNITGTVYKDINGNCTLNTTDLRAQNIPIKLYDNQNNFLAQSFTINGVYSFTTLLPDTFQVKIDTTSLPVSMACGQNSTQSVTLTSVNQTIQNINFPVVCNAAYDALVQSVTPQGWVFPGQTHILRTNVTNNSNWYNLNCTSSIVSGTFSIQVNGPVSFVAPAAGALTPTVSGNTYTYNIANFTTLNPNSFGLQLMTDTTAQATDQVCVHVEISPNPIDADTNNNVYDFCYNVVNSYDPNMKEVYPVDVLPGYDDWFTYTIHFQNTGNAPAFNIRLRDTLDTQLDLNTFEVLGYSHPATVGLSGNILTVRFNNIMLPDSTSDYEGSMGYFQYRIKPNGVLLSGSQISNTAYIYFDYNSPIITNTTENNFFCFPVNYPQSYLFCAGDSVLVGNNWYSSAANYSNSYVSTFGCDSIVNVTINQTTLDTSLFASGDTIYANENYMNYEWINCANDSTLQNSASNNFIIPFTGNFKVKITNNEGCNVVSNCIPLSIICLPISSEQTITICSGDSVQVGNNWYSSAGNYTNSFVTPVGCDSIVNTLITETSIDTSVVLNGNTLNAVSGYSNYSWIDCSTGLEIDGENSNILVAPYAGFFKSVITSTDGCVSESSCIGVILTGIETTLNSNTQTFEIYPNPSSGIFMFKDTKNIQRVEVYNVLGQEIAVFVGDNTNKVSKQINLSSYSKGIYFAKINGSVVLKMVKE
ncbi:MAG: T9SS type A sorting domain-containing protein [Bacteroidota bacterium]